jgi:hypothetical protein
MDTNHALNCPYGGLPKVRHDEIRDVLANILRQTGVGPVSTEPLLNLPGVNRTKGDIQVRGLLRPGHGTVMDVKVMNTSAPSVSGSTVAAVLQSAETQKETKYRAAAQAQGVSFISLVFGVDGSMGVHANAFLRRVSGLLAMKWNQPYSTTMNWMRARITCAIARASPHCIRGTRYRAPVPLAPYYAGGLGASADDDLIHLLQRDTIED